MSGMGKSFDELVQLEWQAGIDRHYPQFNKPIPNRAEVRSLSRIVEAIGARTLRLIGYIIGEWQQFTKKCNDAGTSSHRLPAYPSATFLYDHLPIALKMCGDRKISLDDEDDDDAQDAPPAAQGRLRA